MKPAFYKNITHFPQSSARAILSIFLFVNILALMLSGCAPASLDTKSTNPLPPDSPTADSAQSSLEQIQERGVLIVGTAVTEPFVFHDPQTNELTGFDIDTARYIADALGVELSLVEMPFATLLPSLQDRKVDMTIAAMYITPEREELVDFAAPYIDTGLVMVVKPGSPIKTVEDLNGLRVGVKIGATGAKLAQELISQGIQIEIKEYKTTFDSLLDLEVDRLDVVFNDYLNTLFYIKQSQSSLKIVSNDDGEVYFLADANLGIAVHQGDREMLNVINKALREMKNNGSYDESYKKWLIATTSR
jgi:ABC-type amino acid transport substrate-binding protein